MLRRESGRPLVERLARGAVIILGCRPKPDPDPMSRFSPDASFKREIGDTIIMDMGRSSQISSEEKVCRYD